MESEKETEMSQEADDSSCREEYAADKGWAQEAATTDQGDQRNQCNGSQSVSPRRRRQASTQEDAQVTSEDHCPAQDMHEKAENVITPVVRRL